MASRFIPGLGLRTCPPTACPTMEGPTGPTGPTSTVTGPTGPVGSAGTATNTGATGPTGNTGPTGRDGSATNTGATGPTGPRGFQGAIGPIGPTGTQGPTGPAGVASNTGATGPTGASILITNAAATRITTSTSSTVANAEANLTFNGSLLNVNGDVSANIYNGPGGTAGAPHYTFSDDRTTGIFFPSAGIIGFTTSGSEQLRITTSGISNSGTTTNTNIIASGYIRNALTPTTLDISGGNISNSGIHTTLVFWELTSVTH